MSNTKAVGYVRVSTEQQADEGVSLDAQEAKLRLYAKLHSIDLVEVIVDAGESAKTLNRPGLQRALGMIESGEVSALIVVKLDRLTRRVGDLCDLVERCFQKAALLSVSEQIDTRTTNGRMMMHLFSTFAEWERDTIADRTRDALRHKRSRGEYAGGRVAYGRKAIAGKGLAVDETEAALVATARELRAGGLSLRKVADELSRRGFKPRKAATFAPNVIADMVKVAA